MKRVIFDGSVSVEVEIVAVRDSRMEIRYPSGAQLTVPQSWLAPGQPPVLTVVAHEAVVESTVSGLPMLSEAQYRVLRALLMAGPLGLIDDEHLDIHNMAPTSAGKRRLELKRKGFVCAGAAPNDQRDTRWGKPATVWMITEAGREALRVHEQLLQPA